MKIDTHIHFGGSIPTQTIWEIIQENKLYELAGTQKEVEEGMIFKGGGFEGFLDKFKILDEIEWNEEILDKTIKAVSDTFEDLDFVWLDFSINKYLRYMKMSKYELIQFFHDKFKEYSKSEVALVLSIKYESLDASKRSYMKLIEEEKIANLIAGIDLVGDESRFEISDFDGLKPWYEAGKMVRLHVGEMGHDDHVIGALRNLPITNIAHGIDIIRDLEAIKIAKDKDIQFDLALTSNLKIREMKNMEEHPISIMDQFGLKLTLGSDDPVVFGTNLDNEFALINDELAKKCQGQSLKFCQKFGYLLDAVSIADN